MTKTIYIFTFFNGDYSQSDCLVANIDLTTREATKKATEYLESEYEYDRKYFEITEVYQVSEVNIKEVITSRLHLYA